MAYARRHSRFAPIFASVLQAASSTRRLCLGVRGLCLQRDSARQTFTQCSQRVRRLTALGLLVCLILPPPPQASHSPNARRMVAFQLICLLCFRQAASFTQPKMRTRSAATSLRSGATQQSGELKDYAGAAGGLFGTYRIPASLFAGASAGAAFAMPIVLGEAATLGSVVSVDSF